MATLRPNSGTPMSPPGTQALPASPNTASLSPSPTSGYTSPGSPSTTATSTATTALPSNDEVEAVIKQATSTRPTPDGRPPPGKDTRTQLFTGNLPYRVRWQDLKDLFRRAGTVLRADVSLSPDNRSRGYGTVLLASAEDAGRAVDMFNGYSWQGRVLEVRLDRLGAVPGAELDAGAAAMVPGAGMSALPMGVNLNGMNVKMNGMGPSALNGLRVPSPRSALPYVAQHLTGNGQNLGTSPAPPPATSSLSAALSGPLSSASPLNTLNPGLIALQQQQQALQEREREEFLMNQVGAAGQSGLDGLDSFLGTLGRGLSGDFDREWSRSNLGTRSLFVGNLPFHCQWQDLKDLFRQAGTILRADVSLGPDGRSRGFGTVSYANEIDAERAVAMFNGFDYNGRMLKVHYDKFSAQSPFPSNMSSHPSTLSTPVQPAATSTQAALLQAAQLQQLVSGQTYERYGNFTSLGGNSSSNSSSSSNTSGAATQVQAQTLGSSLQTLRDSLQMQSQVHSAMTGTGTGTGTGNEQAGTSASANTSESSASPFSHHLMGTSPSLAERRQKLPAPIGSASSSRPSSGSNANVNEELSISTALSAGISAAKSFITSSVSPPMNRRPTGQSLPASSASVPIATSEEISSSNSKRPATSSSIPTLASTSASTSTSKSRPTHSSHSSSTTSSASPRTSHPAHPGPIALPPPPSVSAFPLYSPHHHPLSPQGHPMSPPGAVYAGYPPYGQMNPMHPYPLPAHMHAHNMTPHGLPPITPSMPSFSFVPQPSPSVPAGGSSAIPPTPAEGGGPPPEGYAASGPPGDSTGNPMAMGMGMMSMMSPPLHLSHHVFQPFTPGAAMSPGAFYGPPNGATPRGTYLNPAVGSPVLIHPPFGFPPPGSQPGSPYYQPNPNGGTYGEEPCGYFPPVSAGPPPPRHEGYFPPVSALGSSGLANEILKDGSSMNMNGYDADERPAHERNDSGSAPASSENGPEEDTDAERARSSSSGATSWRSSDENAPSAASSGVGAPLDGLARNMASVRLGSPPKGRNMKRSDASYAAAAAADKSKSVQRSESACSADDVAGYPPAARHLSMGSEGSRRPAAPQKTHSDETGTHVRLITEGITASS